MKLIVRKQNDIFDFCESSDGIEYDGIIYGGTSVKLSYTNESLVVSVDGGEKKTYPTEDLNYDDGNEIIGFASMSEFIVALKGAGFTGNFNTAGASAQIYKAYLTQSGTDAPSAIVIKNTIGDINWSYSDVGVYSANLIGAFTENKTSVILPNQVRNAGDGTNKQMWWCVEDSSSDSIVIQTSGASENNVMFKQIIIIEVER